jgi:integrase
MKWRLYVRRPFFSAHANLAFKITKLDGARMEVMFTDFQSARSTLLNGRGFDPDVIEAALAHQDKNAIRRTYNRATYWPGRVKLMQTWADMLELFQEIGGLSAFTADCRRQRNRRLGLMS